MAKTKRKHLAALAAMAGAGDRSDGKSMVGQKQIEGEKQRGKGTDLEAGRQQGDGTASSKAQQTRKSMPGNVGGALLEEDAEVEVRKRRVIIKIPPLPLKQPRKRKQVLQEVKAAQQVQEHAEQGQSERVEHESGEQQPVVESVDSKRRKIGVDLLKQDVSTLLANIDKLITQGDWKKETVPRDGDNAENDGAGTQKTSPSKHPRKKRAISDLPTGLAHAIPVDFSAVSDRDNLHLEGGSRVPRDADCAEASSDSAAAQPPKKGIPRQGLKGSKRRSAISSSDTPQKQKRQFPGASPGGRKRWKEDVSEAKQNGALDGHVPGTSDHKQANGPDTVGSPCSPPQASTGANGKDPLASAVQEQTTPLSITRSLRSHKGPLLGAYDLPVYKRRRRVSKANPSEVDTEQASAERLTSIQNRAPERADVASGDSSGGSDEVQDTTAPIAAQLQQSPALPESCQWDGPSTATLVSDMDMSCSGSRQMTQTMSNQLDTFQTRVRHNSLFDYRNSSSQSGGLESSGEKELALGSTELVDEGPLNSLKSMASVEMEQTCTVSLARLKQGGDDARVEFGLWDKPLSCQPGVVAYSQKHTQKGFPTDTMVSTHHPTFRMNQTTLSLDRQLENLTNGLKAAGGTISFLRSQGLEQLVPIFEAHELDESSLLQLTMSSLKDKGIHALGPRRKLISAISKLSNTQ